MKNMTKLLQEAVKKLALLPEARQDELAQMLLDTAASDLTSYKCTDEELLSIKKGLEDAAYGRFATDVEVAKLWDSFRI